MTWRRGRRWRAGLAAVACLTTVCALGQKAEDRPATDSAAQASPVTPAPASAKATDASRQASPAAGQAPRGGGALVAGATVQVTLDRGIDSGRLHNGESVAARLASPVRTASGVVLPSGTAAVITVVETVPAGKLTAAGEFSLQLVRVGTVGTATDFRVYRGKAGQKEVADAAPALGTDAGLPAGATLEFHVMGLPGPANGPPAREAEVPGAVNGTASGAAPPAGSRSNSGEPVFGQTKSGAPKSQARPVQPANNTFGPAQHEGQAGAAPNQPSSPATGASGTAPQGATTEPR